MKKFALKSALTVGKLRVLLKDLDDDALVLARECDYINLEVVHVVNPTAKAKKTGSVATVTHIEKVYGGDWQELDNKSKQAIIFCNCD